ncbi:MAG: rubrerythrin family protein [candidate division Zixibacteria bacterium]|nr:rubrerythrin family protein [candidate division Zixibacteria bacterium]
MPTSENLKAAFAGESQANRKYLAYAKKADNEGFAQVAKLFRAIAAAETVHAHSHFRVMGGVKTTIANLEDAIAGEAYEFQTMYPEFVATGEKEQNSAAVSSFKHALAVERIHHELYSKALASVKAGADLTGQRIYVCEVCGHTVIGDAPDKCPVCGASKAKFNEIA